MSNSEDEIKRWKLTGQQAATFEISFLLLVEYSALALAGILDALQTANHLRGQRYFRWNFHASDLNSPGFLASAVFDDELLSGRSDLVVVVGDDSAMLEFCPKNIARIRNLARRSRNVCGIGAGVPMLAQAGLLIDKTAAVHFSQIPALSEQFRDTNFTERRFYLDRRIWTCAGGAAALDLALAIVKRELGLECYDQVCSHLLHQPLDSGLQRVSVSARFGMRNDGLLRAISYIEALGDEPYQSRALAQHVGLSPRQLERLFREFSGQTPAQYDRHFRLRRARDLIRHTNLSLREISVTCGFANLAHFSRKYRAYFGKSAARDRSASALTDFKFNKRAA